MTILRKRLFALLTAIIMLISMIQVTVYAVTPRALSIIPGLSFTRTTASCTLTVISDSTGDKIEAIIKLWDGSTCLETWTVDGKGYVFFSEKYNVTCNREYTLTADVEINDVAEPRVSVTEKCE